MIKLFIYSASIIAFLFVGYFSGTFFSKEKTAYVNIAEIYDAYPLKKELEAQLRKDQQVRDKSLDSLELELKTLSVQLENDRDNKKLWALFQVKRDEYAKTKQQYNEQADAEMGNYKDQIWKQLNQYIKDYGKLNKYDYIFSKDDSYYLLYQNDRKNITESLKKFLLKKYEGK